MENVSAKEVEDLLFGHPDVADIAVIGVPDDRTGERVCAVVVPADPAAPPSLPDLATWAREQGLMTQKLPERLEIVDVLPRNPTGKVLKFELRSRFGAASAGAATTEQDLPMALLEGQVANVPCAGHGIGQAHALELAPHRTRESGV